MKRTVVELGDRYGKAVITGEAPPKGAARMVNCLCDCGAEFTARLASLRYGSVVSCGCRKRTVKTTHGGSYDGKLYWLWRGIRNRCLRHGDDNYSSYGGRGITVSAEWAADYAVFKEYIVATLGPCPAGSSLDREDNDKGYEPGNVRWATWKQQGRNRRNNVRLMYRGIEKTLPEWAEEIGISPVTLATRLRRSGGDVETALAAPVQQRRRQA